VILKIGVIFYTDGRMPHVQFYHYFIILLRNEWAFHACKLCTSELHIYL